MIDIVASPTPIFPSGPRGQFYLVCDAPLIALTTLHHETLLHRYERFSRKWVEKYLFSTYISFLFVIVL